LSSAERRPEDDQDRTPDAGDLEARLASCNEIELRHLLTVIRKRVLFHPLEARFGAPAELILGAIERASDFSRRGVLGLIAEASFEVNVVDQLNNWQSEPVSQTAPWDFQLRRNGKAVRVQVKRQRLEMHEPKLYRRHPELYVAETQRSRRGQDGEGGSTRPYRFGEFDILAVSIQPVTKRWEDFRYAPQRWLIPRTNDATALDVLQPVALKPNDDRTDSFTECVQRWIGGETKVIRSRS